MASRFSTIAAASLMAFGAVTSAAPAHALDEQQKKEIGQFVKEYLIENPEIMLEVQEALEKKQYAARAAQAQTAVDQNKAAIFSSGYDMSLGNPNGDVTIVEFFDYNCGYCKRALSDMEAILSSDKNVRFVLKEFPILGPESLAAHKVSAAFKQIAPEKYGQFHRMLMGAQGRVDETSALQAAQMLGVDEKAIRKTIAEKPNDAAVKETYQLASNLGITGTPSYVVGNEAVFGAIGSASLAQKIANMRACGRATC